MLPAARVLPLVLAALSAGCGQGSAPSPAASPTSAPQRDVLADVKARGVLRVGMEANAAPMLFTDEAGRVTGFEYRLMQEVAAGLGVALEPMGGAFKDLPEALRIGALDMVMGGWIPSPAVDASFSDPYFESGLCLVVKKGSALASVEDLDGRRVAIYADPTVEGWAKKALAGAEVQVVDDGYFNLLVSDRIDAVVYDYPFAIAEIQPYRDRLRITQLNLQTFRYAALVPRGADSMLDAVNEQLRRIRSSPAYEQWLEEFFAVEDGLGDVLSVEPPAVPAGARTHVVKPGESLRELAERYYGDAERWKELWAANRTVVGIPERPRPGLRLLVP